MIDTTLQRLDTDSFERIVYEKESPCLVIFMRKTCHVCEEVVPTLEELEPEYKEKCGFYAVDVEEQKKLFQRFSLKSIPQILFFNDGEYQGKMAGLVEDDAIEERIAEIFG
ncbi:thioredoxin family protein [Desulfomonile tiedjei]|uniref:Thioredoxin domain-containing protein n=1 Tax=Desulfomonile tiedjei (strain ATCC 49306 / DSM 6799 / DCB-1) TaxID=706587 RepID=I4CDV2_DESTA|nr:thioredoxin family protein [Desulfomonile tiedjei]AFM27743.1 thioredoxin domain-containing protein [Desulfomonile tiedjei DSM 6799]